MQFREHETEGNSPGVLRLFPLCLSLRGPLFSFSVLTSISLLCLCIDPAASVLVFSEGLEEHSIFLTRRLFHMGSLCHLKQTSGLSVLNELAVEL